MKQKLPHQTHRRLWQSEHVTASYVIFQRSALIQENPVCSYCPRAQTTLLRFNGWVSSAQDTSLSCQADCAHSPSWGIWPVGRERSSLHPEKRGTSPSAGAQLLLLSRCAGSQGTGTAPKHSCNRSTALTKSCAQQLQPSLNSIPDPSHPYVNLCSV